MIFLAAVAPPNLEVPMELFNDARPITHEEETELRGRINAGDRDAFDRLVTAHLHLAYKVAVVFAHTRIARQIRMDLDDLVGEANLALVHAARDADPSSGFRFMTFAKRFIEHRFFNAAYNRRRLQCLSLDAPLPSERLHERTIADMIPDENVVDHGEQDLARKAKARIEIALLSLDDQERAVIQAQYLDDEPKDLALSVDAVRRIETAALAKLREHEQLADFKEIIVGRGRGSGCNVPGCKRPKATTKTANGLCWIHARRVRRAAKGPCSVPGCERSMFAKALFVIGTPALCSAHYSRARRAAKKRKKVADAGPPCQLVA